MLNLAIAYGDSGSLGKVSTFGGVLKSPYKTPPVDVKITRVCASLAFNASMRLRVPRMLIAASVTGSATLFLTSIWPAKCVTTSKRLSRTSSANSCEFTPICRNRALSGTFGRFPVERSSTTVTSNPRARKRSATCEPMNPAPPVTRTLGNVGRIS